jgi:hypothetical protein
MNGRIIIEKFGGQTALSRLLGKPQSTVSYWAKTGKIPNRWWNHLMRLAQERGIELSVVDFVSNEPQAATLNANGNNALVAVQPASLATAAVPPTQGRLDLGIERQTEIDGVGMGVLTDGTPFLTGRGLARLVGVHHRVIQDITNEWHAPESFPRVARIREILRSHNVNVEQPYIPIQQRSGLFYAYPDILCMAILEYYAFDAANPPGEAKKNFRLLAGTALRNFIYTQVGYDPQNAVPVAWRQFHDRVSLTYNAVPKGHFAIFKEMADMIVTLGQSGLHIDSKFVPDISVGQAWSKHWNSAELGQKFGDRVRYEHNYPGYFPQAASNPQEPWCYPENALGEFRRWLRDVYIGEGKFKSYIEAKVKERALPPSFAQLAIAAYVRE